MALVELQTPVWQYDTVTKELVITLFEGPPIGDPDPANWHSPRKATVRVSVPAGTVVTPLP